MRSIIKNKNGFEMGWTEMMYLILGLLLIVLILTPIFMKTSWGDIIKGWLPSMNTTQGEKYGEISGKDEVIPVIPIPSDTLFYDSYIIISSSNLKGISVDTAANFNGEYYIMDEGGKTQFYLKSTDFKFDNELVLYQGSDKVVCKIKVGAAIPLTQCPIFYLKDSTAINYFVLGGPGQIMFFQSLEEYNSALNSAKPIPNPELSPAPSGSVILTQ